MAMLYDLTNEYMYVGTLLSDSETAEDLDAAIQQFENVKAPSERKWNAVARIVRNLNAEAEACDAEGKRLVSKAKARRNAADRVMQYVHYVMESHGLTEIKTDIGKFRIAKNPWSVAVLDESKVPEEFLIPQPPKVDKTAIMQRFRESGEIIDGCDMVQREGVRFR